jgi:predicted ArsR family transcriptional regulator
MSSTARSAAPAALAALSNLDDPLRRKLYEYVTESATPVSREEAATAVEIGRTLAAYHLDKLADADLLTISYQRPAGRSGPGAGRPAKLYARATKEMAVSVPPRDYELLARLLVSSVEQDASGAVRNAVHEAALDAGRRSAAESGGNLLAALRSCGYLPQVADDGRVELRNCPFHLVAQDHLDVVCGLNLRLVEGMIAGSAEPRARAVLDPRPDRCCVVVDPPES